MAAERDLLDDLRAIVGRRHVLTGAAMGPFTTGYRYGSGKAEAVIRPGSLVEMWHVARAAVGAGRIILTQAANTGLTGGSTPCGSYDREVILISTMRISGTFPLAGGKQVVCLAGTTLYELEAALAPLGREPHSVIGSSCIGASVVGGVCNNSGGALVRRGPAYTEYALFGRVAENGEFELCNHLGLALGSHPEQILAKLDAGLGDDILVEDDTGIASAAKGYESVVRDLDAASPARFNANPDCLFEASGSAGRLLVFALRLDTFTKEAGNAVFYIGTNDPTELAALRRAFLRDAPGLPISGEYIHREAFDFADRYGKDTAVAISTLGTARLPRFFALKARFDRLIRRVLPVGGGISDRMLQFVSRFLPDHLPKRLRGFRSRFEHHLILSVAADSIQFSRELLGRLFPGQSGDFFECTQREAERAMLHRFAVAGAAVRYRSVHPKRVGGLVALDIALPRNACNWYEKLPEEIERSLVGKLYYGHFFCHVFHQDYLVRKGVNPEKVERALLDLADSRGAEYPAEHNVGHHYPAKPSLERHYRQLDPTNSFNPGIGMTSRRKDWQ